MKISITNINLFFGYLILLILLSTLSYISISYNLIFGELVFVAKFFLVVLMILNIIFLFLIIKHFKILIFLKNSLLIISPFIFSFKNLNYTDITYINWETFIDRGRISTIYRRMTLKLKKGKIEFSDMQFENLDIIFKEIMLRTNIKLVDENKEMVDYDRAKFNLTNTQISFLSGLIMLGFAIYLSIVLNNLNEKKLTIVLIIAISGIIIMTSNFIKYLNYKKIISKHK